MHKILTNKQYLLVILFVIPAISLFSQGLIESRLNYNPIIAGKKKHASEYGFLRSSSIADTINLGPKGIFDDFAYLNSYPDSSIWLDSSVYVNRTYAISPPTIGVATFDGLDSEGYPYNFFMSDAPQPADTLTSKPINLNYPDVDSIYLSFYCQPQGIGNDPQSGDNLTLEFKSPDSASVWEYIWSSDGYALTDSTWKYVMIPITNPAYLKKGFQFRFRNNATINGNYDQWNVDNVYLNRIRTINDNVMSDISWVYQGRSLLKDYTAIPWKQYTTAELNSKIDNYIRNNDSILKNVNYTYEIDNITNSSAITSFNGAGNINPFVLNKRYTDCDVPLGCISSVPVNISAFPGTMSAPTQIQVTHYFNSGLLGDFSPRNDTLLVVNDFSNYFAYDDGTAESSVGLNSLNAQLAIQFTLKVADSLSAVDIFFNPMKTNAELYYFNLLVWNDAGGVPGTTAYSSSKNLAPVYSRAGQNIFTRYYLDSPIFLQAGTYYMGFRQKTKEPLNVGLDKNINTQNRVFFRVGANWETSTIKGSLMMRPITGFVLNPNSIEERAAADNQQLVLYPNPLRDKLYIQNITENTAYQLVDIFGKILMEGIYESNAYIDVSSLESGIYFVKTGVAASKFVKVD